MKPKFRRIEWAPQNIERTVYLDDEVKQALLSNPPTARVYFRELNGQAFIVLNGGSDAKPLKPATA